MASGNGGSRLDMEAFARAKLEATVRERDSWNLSPEERANLINTYFITKLGEDLIDPKNGQVKGPEFWDLICYSVNLVSAFAISLEEEMLTRLARAISNHIYSMHYSLPKGHEYLGPQRDEHHDRWMSRINPPGHTDLMVTPESIEDDLGPNPNPNESSDGL